VTGRPTLHNQTLLALARVAWPVAAILVIALAALSAPDMWREAGAVVPAAQRSFSQLSPAEAGLLRLIGIPIAAYSAFVVTSNLLPAAVFLLVASIIFLRRSDDRNALLMAYLLAAIGAAVPFLSGITRFSPELVPAINIARGLGIFALLLLAYVFPDGRFVPPWTRLIALVWGAWVVYWVAVPRTPYAFVDPGGALTPTGLVFMLAGFGAGAYAQVHRYRRISSPVQRQQAKVFAFGFSAVFGLYALTVLPYFLAPGVRAPGWPYFLYALVGVLLATRLAFALVPLTIGFAVLRYRLWDIDVIIRRTLIYTVLTGALAVVYLLAVVALQQGATVLTGTRQSELTTVVSTLAIAALFGPLRRMVQQAIDRRFYRRKVDLSRLLADFARTLPEEVDAQRLADRLASVVAEAVQPAHVGVWIRGVPRASEGAEQAARRRDVI
jgi:hypothetical protein